jgi:type VI secretion system secreted protein VgrG
MPKYSQGDRALAITTPLGTDVLLVTGLQGHEAISQLFNFKLDLLAEAGREIPFDAVLGRNVTVELRRAGERRYFNGLVSRFGQGRRDDAFLHFHAEIVPNLWLLTKKTQCRVFQHLSVPDILRRVFSRLDVAYEFLGTYYERDYCVQYRESDFNFASRLMEEEGIYYFFKHRDGGHQMVVTDTPNQHPVVPGSPTVIYDELSGGERDEERVTRWEKTQELRAGTCTLWDHSFELPGNHLEAKERIVEGVAAGKVTHKFRIGGNDQLEIFDYPGGYAQRFDGIDQGGAPRPQDLQDLFRDKDRTIRVRMEEEEVSCLGIEGASGCGQFTAGHTFDLERHFDADDRYLLTRVEHDARLDGDFRSSDEPLAFTYENRFTCIPAVLPFRPGRSMPKPVIAGVQTATVVGHRGEEILCDKYGRVKVQFHWDRNGKRDANSSCWIRVAQVWAGKGWGAFFWPRVGHEVVVAFEEGDPDQPIIVGSVYNAENLPAYPLPLRNKLAGFKSASFHGRPFEHFNGIIFSDEKGHEHLAIHSERHMTFNAEYDKSFHAGRHRNEVISSVATITVGSLPGAGSGGGGPDDWNPMKHSDPDGVPGINSIMVYGENLQVAVGINHQLAVGSNLQLCINPAALLSALNLEVPQIISGLLGSGIGGNMQCTLGTSANVVLGDTFDIKLGKQHFTPSKSEHRPGTEIVCGLLGAVVLLWVVLYGLAKTEQRRFSMVVVFQAVISALLAALMTIEEAYSRGKETFDVALCNILKAKSSEDPPTPIALKDAVIGAVEGLLVLGLAASPAVIAAAAEPGPSTTGDEEKTGTVEQA